MHVQLLIMALRLPRTVMRGFLPVATMLAVILSFPCAAGESLEEGHAIVQRTWERLSGPDHDWRERGAQVDRVFDTSVLPHTGTLSSLAASDLRVLLRATHAAAVASKQPRYSTIALRVGLELRRRGELHPADARAGAAIAMLSRDATALTPASPWLAAFNGRPVPRFPDVIRPLEYWTPGPDGESFSSAQADQASLDIIVIAHPACGFTRAAAEAARTDPELMRVLSGPRALWLSPQEGTLDPRIFRDWNDRHFDLPIHIVARQSGFSEVGYWGTPTFYTLRDGGVVARVVGWPRGGNKAMLTKAIADAAVPRRSR
ncbi:MAG TPA: hypothetical protein DIV57_02635 [Stenotrophomonas sp.]|nr:hypothetical protein [Stenotrophomonas sp.]